MLPHSAESSHLWEKRKKNVQIQSIAGIKGLNYILRQNQLGNPAKKMDVVKGKINFY